MVTTKIHKCYTPTKFNLWECHSYGALIHCIRVYPGFHFGLCPHSTLGFAGVSYLKALTPASPNKSDNKRKQRHRPITTPNNKYNN